MNLDLKHKNALVGGSSKGIGRAVAIELASLGANITLMARTEEKLIAVQAELDTSQGQQHDYLVVDFDDSQKLQQKIAVLVQFKPIHILVNNTGGPKGGNIVDALPQAFMNAIHNHVVCNHVLLQTVLPGMQSEKYGRIINIISTSVKQPIDGLGVSNTTRSAVANWAKTMANELASSEITVNNVLPGYTATERLDEIITDRATKASISVKKMSEKMRQDVPMQRFGHAAEIAAAVGFLASPAAAYITGINLPVDGGRTKSL